MLDLRKYAANLCRGVFHKISRISFHTLINYNLGQWSIQISLWISQTIVLLIKCNYQFRNYESWMFTKRFMNDPFLTSKDRLILWCMYIVVLYVLHNLYSTHDIFFFQTKDREEEKWKSLTSMQWRIDQNSEVMPKWFELVNRWLELMLSRVPFSKKNFGRHTSILISKHTVQLFQKLCHSSLVCLSNLIWSKLKHLN